MASTGNPSPLRELIVFFRKNERIPKAWIQRFSATGELDSAAAGAWQAETDGRPMLWLVPYFADPKAMALVAVDLGRMLLGYMPKKHTTPARALDLMEAWATSNAEAPKLGWPALADAVELPEDRDTLANHAATSIGVALTVPEHPFALTNLGNAVVERKADELIEAEKGGAKKRRTEEEIEEIEGRAEAAVLGPMAAHVRRHISAPRGAELREALTKLRTKELEQALATKSPSRLQAFGRD